MMCQELSGAELRARHGKQGARRSTSDRTILWTDGNYWLARVRCAAGTRNSRGEGKNWYGSLLLGLTCLWYRNVWAKWKTDDSLQGASLPARYSSSCDRSSWTRRAARSTQFRGTDAVTTCYPNHARTERLCFSGWINVNESRSDGFPPIAGASSLAPTFFGRCQSVIPTQFT